MPKSKPKKLAGQLKFQVYFKRPKTSEDTLYQMHKRWFFSIDAKQFRALTKDWNEQNLAIKIEAQEDYDAWLNYFKKLPARYIQMLAATGLDFLDTEAYAALSRWHDIVENPHRIDKIHQSGLTKSKEGSKVKTVAELALANDRLGVLRATRDKIAEKLDKGAGSRDTALLTREMTEIMTQISDYEKRAGPKKDTKLGELLTDMHTGKAKRSKNKGARNTSFKTRVTIEDLE